MSLSSISWSCKRTFSVKQHHHHPPPPGHTHTWLMFCLLSVGQEEGAVHYEEGVQITPFNMQDEMDEGHFDKDGMYIFDRTVNIGAYLNKGVFCFTALSAIYISLFSWCSLWYVFEKKYQKVPSCVLKFVNVYSKAIDFHLCPWPVSGWKTGQLFIQVKIATIFKFNAINTQ